MSGRGGGVTVLCIPHAQDLVRGGPGCVVCALEAGNERLRSRLAEVEQARDSAFETWKKFHQDTLAAFIKNEHEPLKARLAEAEFDLKSASEAMRRYAHDALRLKETEAQRDQMREAILWALGERDEFPEEPELLAGKYKRRFYWRTELRRRAFGAADSATHRENERE